MRTTLPFLWLALCCSCVQLGNCASTAGGPCEPRNANCPGGYYCSLAEVCTRACAQTSDCWVQAVNGCLSNSLPGMTTADGGMEELIPPPNEGYCADSLAMVCLDGYCQQNTCLDGGCDYDPYGPSPFKGNRTQGPSQ